MRSAIIILFIALLHLNGQAQTNEELIGDWAMESAADVGENVTAQEDPHNERWIQFQSNGSFKSDGRPVGKSAGQWTYDVPSHTLALKSNSGDNDSKWLVHFEDEKMSWRGLGEGNKTTMVVTYVRMP
ncbi:MAG: hypothetical protein HQ500_04050 [Flavobacteriales bacterium]|nr:hypothetical protein [Flavobacteriales bacterium]